MLLWCVLEQEVAVFVLDKKMLEKHQRFDKEQVLESLKKGVQQLTRLRHPRLLTVQHPLEESRYTHIHACTHTHTHTHTYDAMSSILSELGLKQALTWSLVGSYRTVCFF